MPPESLSLEQRFVFVERDLQSHAKTLTVHNEEMADLRIERAEAKLRAEHIDERFDRLEKSITGIHRLGWWILGTFGAAFIALVANFLFRGGFVA